MNQRKPEMRRPRSTLLGIDRTTDEVTAHRALARWFTARLLSRVKFEQAHVQSKPPDYPRIAGCAPLKVAGSLERLETLPFRSGIAATEPLSPNPLPRGSCRDHPNEHMISQKTT
jgi:hypothetical protein